jgi:hypothetical protein
LKLLSRLITFQETDKDEGTNIPVPGCLADGRLCLHAGWRGGASYAGGAERDLHGTGKH